MDKLKTLTFVCLMLSVANMIMALFFGIKMNTYGPFAHSLGSVFLASMIYFPLADAEEDKGK